MISGLCIVRFSQLLQILIRSRLISFHMLYTTPQIAGIAPTQPWKIRDHTSAGSQRLALPGLASRLHSIYTYTFPSHHATAAAEALVHLYAQKGHDLHACRRFLRKKTCVFHRSLCAPITACCVCHTLVLRVFHLFTFPLPPRSFFFH